MDAITGSSGTLALPHTSFEHLVVHPSHALASPSPSSPSSISFENSLHISSSSSSPSSGYGFDDDDRPLPTSSAASTLKLGSPFRKSNAMGLEFLSSTTVAGRPRSTSSPSPSRKRSPHLASHPYTRSSSPREPAPSMIRSYSLPVDTQSQLERRLYRQGSASEVTGLLERSAASSSAMSSPPGFSFTFPHNVLSEYSPRRAAIQRSQSASSVPTLHIPFFPSILGLKYSAAPATTRPRRCTIGFMTPICRR